MRVQQSVIQKFFNIPAYSGYRRTASENRSGAGARDFRRWIRNIVSLNKSATESAAQGSSSDIEVVNREVHLEGYASHEEVVRAYLAFAGIDPESKEGRLYFEL